MAERSFTSEHVVRATPWDVWEVLVDPEQQAQWRSRFEEHAPTIEESPYTRIVFADGLLLELEPEGADTLLRATRVDRKEGLGAVGLVFRGRKGTEQTMHDQLVRIASTVEYRGI
jgi:hypothetical protein